MQIDWDKKGRRGSPLVDGLTVEDHDRVRNFDPIRQADITSIRLFMEANRQYLKGRILDFGAGKPGTCREPQPYRNLVCSGSEYLPYDLGDALPEPPFDTIMCNQVLHLLDCPQAQMRDFADWLKPQGIFICTYATNWDEIESMDGWRCTKTAMERLLVRLGLHVIVHERRVEVKLGCFTFPIGYGVVCSK